MTTPIDSTNPVRLARSILQAWTSRDRRRLRFELSRTRTCRRPLDLGALEAERWELLECLVEKLKSNLARGHGGETAVCLKLLVHLASERERTS